MLLFHANLYRPLDIPLPHFKFSRSATSCHRHHTLGKTKTEYPLLKSNLLINVHNHRIRKNNCAGYAWMASYEKDYYMNCRSGFIYSNGIRIIRKHSRRESSCVLMSISSRRGRMRWASQMSITPCGNTFSITTSMNLNDWEVIVWFKFKKVQQLNMGNELKQKNKNENPELWRIVLFFIWKSCPVAYIMLYDYLKNMLICIWL